MAARSTASRIVHRHPVGALPALSDLVDGFRRHELLVRASAIAFRTLFALIPLVLFALALAGTLSLDSIWTDHLAPQIAPKVSSSVYDILDTTAVNVLGQRQLFWVTAGFVLLTWELAAATRAVMRSLDRIYHGHDEERPLRERVLTSIWLGLAAGACVLAAAAILQFGPIPAILRYLLAAAVLWLTVGLLVRFGPAEPQPLGWISFGSTLVVVGWLVTWSLYGLYLTHLSNVGSAFGAFAAVIVLLTFLQLSASVLLAGALVDALVRKAVTGDRQGT
jgi:membrane protein